MQNKDRFGWAVAALGDLDGDELPELAVGARNDDDGGDNRGAVWVLFLDAHGAAASEQKISDTLGGFAGSLADFDRLGSALASPGDLDGDGVTDLVVGATGDDDGGSDRGAVWVLFLNADGTAKAEQKISATRGGFAGSLADSDGFGSSVASLGDLDGDGVTELVIGAAGDDDGGEDRGAVWVLSIRTDGTVASQQKISANEGGFDGVLDDGDAFGSSVASMGDLDGDGLTDLVVGAVGDDDGGTQTGDVGALWVLFLDVDGTVKGHQKISAAAGPLAGAFQFESSFGSALVPLGDLDGDGTRDLAVGAAGDDEGGSLHFLSNLGAVWVLFLDEDASVKSYQKIGATQGNFAGPLDHKDFLGSSITWLGDLDGDGVGELAVGAYGDDDGGDMRGAVWVLYLEGLVTVDFESANDLTTTMLPLVNGQAVAGTQSFGRPIDIDGHPASGLTAAIFDSDPGGPNMSSEDRDLLVGQGNVLLLQETPGETIQGVYDVPDDDALGGSFAITFAGFEVRPLSIDLIDICPSPSQDAAVTLTDGTGRTRTFVVPAGWTEDVFMDGPPGVRTLDLTTIASQPGYQAVATATEESGFDATRVVMLDIRLGGSGAIDNLVYDGRVGGLQSARRPAPRRPLVPVPATLPEPGALIEHR